MEHNKSLEELEQEVATVKRLFASPDGQKVFKTMEAEFSDRSSFVVGDSHATAFKEGQRSVMLFIIDTLESEYEV